MFVCYILKSFCNVPTYKRSVFFYNTLFFFSSLLDEVYLRRGSSKIPPLPKINPSEISKEANFYLALKDYITKMPLIVICRDRFKGKLILVNIYIH